MAKETLEQYLDGVQPDFRKELERIRARVIKLCPKAEEVMSYGMPGFKYKGKYLLGYGAFKDHLSLFPTGSDLGEIEEDLRPFRTSKGTLQFTPENKIPNYVVNEIIMLRKSQIEKALKI